MIRETYNYLYTRSLLLAKEVLLVEDSDEEKSLYKSLSDILNITADEPYFLDRNDTREMLSEFIKKYRFKYLKSVEINTMFNELIKSINDHKIQDKKISDKEINSWLEREYKDRCLPKKFRDEGTILDFILADPDLFMNMNGFYCFDGVNFEQVPELIFKSLDVVEYLGLMNLLINRDPRYFVVAGRAEALIEQCYSLSTYEENADVLKYIKKTIRNLKRVDRERRIVTRQVVREAKRKQLKLAE